MKCRMKHEARSSAKNCGGFLKIGERGDELSKFSFRLVTLGLLWACLGMGHAETPGDPGFVVICPIDEMVDQGLVVLVQRAVREAQGARALIFEIDTFGGLVDSAVEITEAILKAPCPTIAYIQGKGAISAGALISFACNHIVMAPGTNIGAAEPVYGTPEGALPTGEKEVSFLRSKIAALAEVNGHNPAIAQAMVDKDVELYAARDSNGTIRVWASSAGNAAIPDTKTSLGEALKETLDRIEQKTGIPMEPVKDAIKDVEKKVSGEDKPTESGDQAPPVISNTPTLISAKGKLLTLTSQEAQTYGLIRTTCSNLDQVLGLFGYEGAEKVFIEMTAAERIFRWLTNPLVSSILLMVALAGLYLEVKTPGFGLPGIISIIAFTLFFGARAVLGLADWIDIILVLTGVGLLLAEIFIIPGFGLTGVAGILCILAGIILSFTLKGFSFPEYEWDYARLKDAAFALALTLVLLSAFIVSVWKFFPRTTAYHRLVLAAAESSEAGYVVQDKQTADIIGQRGIALTVLRPAGKGRFGDKTYPVVSRAEYVNQGEEIVIVEVEGNRYVVDPISRSTPEE